MISDDEPIRSTQQDLLGRRPLADRIVQIVVSRPTPAPLVLALHGPWGAGKSSVLALVCEALDEQEIVHVEFQPWLFNSVEELIRPFFATVYQGLVKAGAPKQTARKVVEKFSGLLTAASKLVGHEVDLEGLMKQSPDELRDKISKVSAKLEKRIVVVVDDVDRLPVDELALLFKLVRLCGNLPYFTYILAYDRRVVSTAMRTVYQGDSDFLDKIVQVEVPLPVVPPRLIADYLCGQLRELCSSLDVDPDKIVELFEVGDDETRRLLVPYAENNEPRRLIRSIRDAKRFLNGMSCTLPLVRSEIDLADFTLVELMRIFFPKLYDTVYDERDSFATFDNQTRGGDDRRRAARQAQHRALADELRKGPQGEIAVRILGTLFPVFHASIHSPNQHYGPQVAWQRQMKASDPAHVEKYFQLRVPLDSVPRGEVRAVIDSVNAAPSEAEAIEGFRNRVLQSYERKRLSSFLEGVHLEADRIASGRVASVVGALAEAAPVLAARPMPEREMSTAVIAALRLGARLPEPASSALMASVIARATPAFVVALLVYARPSEYQPSGAGVDFEPMRAAFVTRLQAQLATPGADLFAIYEYEWYEVLRLWGAPQDAETYLLALLAAKPERWSDLASLTVETRVDTPAMNLALLRSLVALPRLAEAARQLQPGSLTALDERARHLVGTFARELTVVPDLIVEVEAVIGCAAILAEVSPGDPPAEQQWGLPVWERTRSQLQRTLSGQPWWPVLVRSLESFSRAPAIVEQLSVVSSPEAGAEAIDAADALHHLGESLLADLPAVVEALRGAIGAQAPVPI